MVCLKATAAATNTNAVVNNKFRRQTFLAQQLLVPVAWVFFFHFIFVLRSKTFAFIVTMDIDKYCTGVCCFISILEGYCY